MRKIFLPVILFLIINSAGKAQVTGLSGWNIFLDPGHSQDENSGIYGYSEAPKVLRVGLALREMLLNETDIDTVYISRTNDQQLVELSQRTAYANQLGAAWYHSIHSDAGGATSNSTLLLWGQYSNGLEKVPNGGKAMSDHMIDLLTRGYRTNTIRGSIGDCSFYGCDFTGPYLHVNRVSTMPSELSEAGFHTHPIQNMINMNADWKRLEARTFFWSILKYHNIPRPAVNIVAGHVKNIEDNKFVNGITVSIDGREYTTDTYESLFKQYSKDPEQLRNGFFYFENVTPGTHTLTINSPGYYSYSKEVIISDTFFTFVDPLVLSSTPPFIKSTTPVQNDSIYPGSQNVTITFSRPMDRTSVETNLVITPSASKAFNWSDGDRKLTITTSDFAFNTDYTLTISGLSKDKYDHPFDGNADSTGGDDYSLQFRTKILDAVPPQYFMVTPDDGAEKTSLLPVINITFDEPVKTTTLSNKLTLKKTSDQVQITLSKQKYYVVNGKGILTGFVTTQLEPNTNYTISVAPGIQDVYGNTTETELQYTFTTGDVLNGTVITFDNFENGIGKWWEPSMSGSTEGYLADETGITSAADIFNLTYGGVKSMKLNYGWDLVADGWLIREYTPIVQSFASNFILKLHLFGDGNGNLFRFCVRDGTQSLEVSKWYTVDWYGWKEVTWNPSVDGFGTWIGDGVLTGTIRLDSYQFTYSQNNNNIGSYYLDDAIILNNPSVDVEDEKTIQPAEYVLDQNYPNPFNPSTKIRFGLKNPGNVKLEVFNLLGQKINTLVNEYLETGYHTVNFDASNLPSGVYVYRIETPGFTSSRKLILMK